MSKRDNPSKTDQILDLLLDALQERQQARDAAAVPVVETAVPPAPEPAIETAVVQPAPEPEPDNPPLAETFEPLAWQESDDNAWTNADELAKIESQPPKLPSIHLEYMLSRLVLALLLLIILINIPFNRFGTTLARAMPDTKSLVVRDGLVLKGSGEEVYVLENNRKRWITTLDAFAFFGYRWEQVNQVDDAYLERFENGRPIYLLLKCQSSPHIYALENGEKRWIRDIATFNEQGFLWEDIKFVNCTQLRRYPQGTPIPDDAGEPPEP